MVFDMKVLVIIFYENISDNLVRGGGEGRPGLEGQKRASHILRLSPFYLNFLPFLEILSFLIQQYKFWYFKIFQQFSFQIDCSLFNVAL